ncbi:MAG: hypothetical protein Q8P95_03785 [bacterium]|nr:hypothetical protein [bacterium]
MNDVKSYQVESGVEEVIVSINDHWVILVRPFLTFVSGWGIFAFLWICSDLLFEVSTTASALLLLFAALLLLVVNHLFLIRLLNWEISTLVVTNKKVIDFRNTPFIEDDTIFINLDEVHEIEKRKHGFFENLLNYGEMVINLAASPEPIIIYHIPNPGGITNLVGDIRDQKLQEKNGK